MKEKNSLIRAVGILTSLIIVTSMSLNLLCSCQKEDQNLKLATINLKFSSDYNYSTIENLKSKIEATGDEGIIPDTNDFILSIRAEGGNSYYNGKYSDRPSKISIPAGSYNVAVYSKEFKAPAFSLPIYGDYQSIKVNSGENIGIAFSCSALNAGIRLGFTQNFKKRFKDCLPNVSNENGKLDYPFTEKRIAYFNPSKINIKIIESSINKFLLSRNIGAGEVLSLTLNCSSESQTANGFSIMLDTTRIWITEEYTIGQQHDGSSKDMAISVADLCNWIDSKEVWVKGYIVGADVSTNSMDTEAPFVSNSNIAIADTDNQKDRKKCAAVELPIGKIRDALNLSSNPSNLKKIVYIKGDIANYFGSPGVKKPKEYELK